LCPINSSVFTLSFLWGWMQIASACPTLALWFSLGRRLAPFAKSLYWRIIFSQIPGFLPRRSSLHARSAPLLEFVIPRPYN
jgi:hypothetical protein